MSYDLDRMSIKSYRKAVFSSDIDAMGSPGILYDEGHDDVPQDFVEALKWYRKAADLGMKSLLFFFIYTCLACSSGKTPEKSRNRVSKSHEIEHATQAEPIHASSRSWRYVCVRRKVQDVAEVIFEVECMSVWASENEIERIRSLEIVDGLLVLDGRILWVDYLGMSRDTFRSKYASLKNLSVNIEPNDIHHIGSDLTEMENLGVRLRNPSPKDFRFLGPLKKNLSSLDVFRSEVSREGFASLSKLRLKNLSFWDSDFTDGLSHLSRLKQLQTLAIGPSDSKLEGISNITHLRNLDLYGTTITEADYTHLSKLKHLRHLNVRHAKITDGEIVHLSKLTQLRYLDIGHNNITDVGIAHLSKLKHLRYLNVRHAKITDGEIVHLSKLTQLRYLDIGHNNITNVGIAHLSKLTQLRHLAIADNNVTDVGIAHLSKLTQLRYLDIADNNITDVGIKHLSELTRLRYLNVGGTNIADSGISNLSKYSQLRYLNVRGTKITDTGLANLSSLTKLLHLSAENTKINGSGFSHLSKLPLLTLRLADTNTTNAGIEEISKLSHLKLLDLSRAKIFTDIGTSHLSELTQLQALYIKSTAFGDIGVSHLQNLPLQTLDISATEITNAGTPHIRSIRHLRDLDIHATKITNTVFGALLKALPNTIINHSHYD